MQKQIVYKHLKTQGSITSREAMINYEIYRLSERVRELESDGVKIKRTTHKSKSGTNYPGCVGEYTRYHYDGEGN